MNFCGTKPKQQADNRGWFLKRLNLTQVALDSGNCNAAHLDNILKKADGCPPLSSKTRIGDSSAVGRSDVGSRV